MLATKECRKCGQAKITALHFSLKSAECKECIKQYNATYRIKMRALSKAVRYNNIGVNHFKESSR